MEPENNKRKDWKKELTNMESDQLFDILSGYIDPLKRNDNLFKAIHDVLLERLSEQKHAPCACSRNALKYTEFEEAISEFPRLFLVIKTLMKEIDAETSEWEKMYLRIRMNTQFDILYKNHTKMRDAYKEEVMDKLTYLKYLELFVELIVKDSYDSVRKNDVVIEEIFQEFMDMKRVRENLPLCNN